MGEASECYLSSEWTNFHFREFHVVIVSWYIIHIKTTITARRCVVVTIEIGIIAIVVPPGTAITDGTVTAISIVVTVVRTELVVEVITQKLAIRVASLVCQNKQN